MSKFIDLIGKTFGSWSVLCQSKSVFDSRGFPVIMWTCQCLKCGEVRDVRSVSLRSGMSKSCGKHITKPFGRANPTFLDRAGLRYGRLIVVSYNEEVSKEKGRAFWDCVCDCGNIYTTSGDHLTDGHVQSCRCLQREVARETNKGLLSPSWNGGVTNFRKTIRNLPEYVEWRISVFLRDGGICQKAGCNKKKRKIESHHIIPLYKILDEYNIRSSEEALGCEPMWDVLNGITVCKECHTRLHTIFGRRDYDVEQAKKWIFEEV